MNWITEITQWTQVAVIGIIIYAPTTILITIIKGLFGAYENEIEEWD